MKHRHFDLIVKFYSDPDKYEVECKRKEGQKWNTISDLEPARWYPDLEYRLVEKFDAEMNGIGYYKAEIIKPRCGDKYFIPDVGAKDLHAKSTWDDNEIDDKYFRHGIVHLSEENAILHAKAMLGIKTEKECN